MNSDRTESASEEHAVSVSAQSVRLWRFRTDSRSVTYRPYCPESVESEPGTWYPQPEDELREAVVAAARAWSNSEDNDVAAEQALDRALDRLDALTKGDA